MSFAKVKWVEDNDRYELHIDGALKAYSKGNHEVGRDHMVKLAEDKGYNVAVVNKKA
jgi:hypothetical protein